VVAISMCGQMHGVTLLDEELQPVHPSIIWADGRAVDETAMLLDTIGRERFVSITGTLPAVGFMSNTLAWMQQHDPQTLEKAAHILLPKDYIATRLTGEVATDYSDAAATALFDIQALTWSDDIIDAMTLPRHIFPTVQPSTGITGTVTQQAADETGLPAGIPVITGSADQPAVAIGNGIIKTGMASVTTGSGGQVFVPIMKSDNLPTDPRLHTFNHAVPDMYYALGAILSAGLSLRWLRGITGLDSNPDAYKIFSAEAAQIPPGSDGLIFLPHLSGERTPHMDAAARGMFMGLSSYHTRGHLARAVMEGVTFALRQALEITRTMGADVETLIIAGGASESTVWRQIQADVFGMPLQQTLQSEQASLGAALIAGVGAGVYASFEEACDSIVRYGDITGPNPANQQRYDAIYQHYLTLYPMLKDTMHSLRNLSG
ncbi:MAG: xylulokinase, partial [Aggregatilineales bacterium]